MFPFRQNKNSNIDGNSKLYNDIKLFSSFSYQSVMYIVCVTGCHRWELLICQDYSRK